MTSPRLHQRLLSVRCVHSVMSNQSALAAHTTQRRFASSSPTPPRQPIRTPTARRTTTQIAPTAAVAAARSRVNAEKEAPASSGPIETAEEYKARYKSAARRWTSTMIALPILLVTSYYLFDRLALGHAQKVLNREPTKRDD
ncbi:hypothetical protein ISF_00317 [Cordyceps fumosorosea ARSEF 2679]|uniref:Uncharacterized protein n=1 Tax=Cordyceps fumosorosea (strain ARSEF 2679) TaxID=1081104 RepID=A0A168E5Y6_CORFA|nr:hypothetical protein ISF_00317 [Cordyceps fumosorosea ARSEF 2679]OAA73416.1 hypothetical protein ISF_00317 [Cordyceps fumosorosea ARSEF 2679]